MTYRHKDVGLLLLRVGVGLMFMIHGWPKISGGPEFWAKIGGAMGVLGIHFAPVFWGLMAALAEFAGGLCLALGIFFIPACLAMAFTMIVASITHLSKGDGFGVASHAIEAAILFTSLALIGPGRFAARLSFRS